MTKITKAEIDRARAWRASSSLTMEQLAGLSGYSPSAICKFESGVFPSSQTTDEHAIPVTAWRRYKMVCLAVDMLLRAGKQVEDWEWR